MDRAYRFASLHPHLFQKLACWECLRGRSFDFIVADVGMSPEQLPRVLENRRADDEIARRHGLINNSAKMAAGRDSRATLPARQNTEH
jgi:hypothetical protein